MGLRRQAREVALQALFVCDFTGKWVVETVDQTFAHFGVPVNVKPFADKLCNGVLEKISDIDSELTKSSQNWSITRMSRVDRCILRVACYEILYLVDVPNSVAINEAIEISKRYSAEDSPSFINGVLDRLASVSKLSNKVESISQKKNQKEEEETPLTREEELERILIG
jgi:N utilization substance protein B